MVQHGTTVHIYDDADSVWTSASVQEVLRNSNIPVEVTDISTLMFPKVMREVLSERGTPTLPLLLSVTEERSIRERYYRLLDQRGYMVSA
ncbi:Uncharacterised protein [Mycobacteroides abscessus subsp. abscessus]|nr:Uncharacterised protein [Mycobacteroides abscessus subsp. abscessus]